MTSKRETFKQARERLFAELTALGWQVTTFSHRTMKPLKVPYATKNDAKLWFMPQAVYLSNGKLATLNDAHSLESDMRGVSAEKLASWVERRTGF